MVLEDGALVGEAVDHPLVLGLLPRRERPGAVPLAGEGEAQVEVRQVGAEMEVAQQVGALLLPPGDRLAHEGLGALEVARLDGVDPLLVRVEEGLGGGRRREHRQQGQHPRDLSYFHQPASRKYSAGSRR